MGKLAAEQGNVSQWFLVLLGDKIYPLSQCFKNQVLTRQADV